jgi:hypothetical protein
MKNEQVLYDSASQVDYVDYVEWCEMNDCEPMGEESSDYYDYVHRVQEWDWEDLLSNLEYSEANDYEWLITGWVGTWQGDRDIYPTIEPNLIKAIESCIGRGMCEVRVTKESNSVKVRISHHDGRNYFELTPLTEDGADRFRRHGEVSLKRKENVVKLPEFLF